MKGRRRRCVPYISVFVKMSTLSRFHTHMRVCFQCVRIFMDQLSFCYLVIKCVNRVKKRPIWHDSIYERLHLGVICASVLKHRGFICPLTQILAAYKPTDGFTHLFHSAKARDQVTPFPTADRVR